MHHPRAELRAQRIYPAQTVESRKIAVGRAEIQSVLSSVISGRKTRNNRTWWAMTPWLSRGDLFGRYIAESGGFDMLALLLWLHLTRKRSAALNPWFFIAGQFCSSSA